MLKKAARMSDALFADICRRLKENVAAGLADRAETVLRVEAAGYRDPDRFDRNTYDLYGPHCRLGFATRRIDEYDRVKT